MIIGLGIAAALGGAVGLAIGKKEVIKAKHEENRKRRAANKKKKLNNKKTKQSATEVKED